MELVAPFCLAVVLLFGILAIVLFKDAERKGKLINTTDFYLTARNTAPWYRVAWGFYACTIGAGVIFSVPSFIADPMYGGGYIGLITYSFFSGFPFMIVALCGSYIKERFPEVLSIGSFAKWRFGRVFQSWVTLNVLFNLGIALSVEFTAIGALGEQYLGLPRYIPIAMVAVVTVSYTTIGGLYISMLTDQFQSIFILLMLTIVGICVGVNFRIPALGPLPDVLGPNYVGYSSFATLGIALISSTLFSDAVWQRVWAAKDKKALYLGATAGFAMATIVTFLFGFGAFITAWAGLVTDPNTAFFELLKVGEGEERAVPFALLLIMMLIASVMNEAAIDSFQIAIGDTLISLFKTNGVNLTFGQSRIIVVLLNVPFAIVGLFGLKVVGLYLITNLLTTCIMMPMVFGMIQKFDRYINEFDAMFGSLAALFSIILYAVIPGIAASGFNGQVIWDGLVNTFYVVYDWPPFIVGLGVSIVGTFLSSAVRNYEYLSTKTLPPLDEHLKIVPKKTDD